MSDRDPLSLHLDTVIEHALIARGMAGPIDDMPVHAEAIDALVAAADDARPRAPVSADQNGPSPKSSE